MPYGWQIKLNGVDISDKVSGFTITCSLDNYCREMSLDIADPDLYAELDFGQISETPEIEILTKTGASYVSQGTFFIERPALASTVDSDLMSGIWGRSLTALLGEPFAPKVTKTWETQTTFFGICQEMCDLAGLTWNPAYSAITDFVIYPYTYEADGAYPIDVITDIAALAGALVTTDRLGHLCIKQIEYSPSAAAVTIVDGDIEGITESPEWPAFGNRIKITPTGNVAGYAVELTIADECLSADGESRTKLYTQVKDADDAPINGLVVSWSINSANAALDYVDTNTREVLIQFEAQKASNFYTVVVDFEISSVLGVWAASDTAKATNLAAAGYEINGKEISLAGKLAFCNQSLVISYYSAGMAVNYLTAGLVAEDVVVTADVEGQEDTGIVYIDNPCQCPPTIELTAAPTSIAIGGTSSLLVYVEESGPVTSGRYVFMAHTSATRRGTLSWTKARLGAVSIKNEKTTAINDIGTAQCEISMYPKSVSAVYRADENGVAYGGNLYSAHDGKIIALSTDLTTGTELLVNYVAQGAVLSKFTGTALGTAGIRAYINSTREEGVEADATIRIEDNTETTDDYPDNDWKKDPDDGDLAGPGGDDEDYDPSKTPDEEEESGGLYNWCVPKSVSGDPNPDALQARFGTALEHDCSCEELCNTEFDIYDTTQNYDGASGRSISRIVIDDYGYDEGSATYWEKFAELKQESLDACKAQCNVCADAAAMVWSGDNPETISPENNVAIYISGGMAPYRWNVAGTGFSLGASATDDGGNLLVAGATACGSATITVTDVCGLSVTGQVRCTAGGWVTIESCGYTGSPGTVEAIAHPYKYIDDYCCSAAADACELCNSYGGCSCTGVPTPFVCSGGTPLNCGCTEGYKIQEWRC